MGYPADAAAGVVVIETHVLAPLCSLHRHATPDLTSPSTFYVSLALLAFAFF